MLQGEFVVPSRDMQFGEITKERNGKFHVR